MILECDAVYRHNLYVTDWIGVYLTSHPHC